MASETRLSVARTVVGIRLRLGSLTLDLASSEAEQLHEEIGRALMPGQVPPVAATRGEPPHLAQRGESHCKAMGSGYACTAQDGHAPPHQAHNTASQVVHSWGDDA